MPTPLLLLPFDLVPPDSQVLNSEEHYKKYPTAVDEDEKVIGIINARDLVAYFLDRM